MGYGANEMQPRRGDGRNRVLTIMDSLITVNRGLETGNCGASRYLLFAI